DLVERTPDGGLRVSGTYAPGACAEGAADAPEAACGIRVVLRHETLREEVRVAEAVAGAETGTFRRRFSVLIAPPLAEGRWEVRLNGLPVRLLGSTAARPAGDEGGGGPVGALRPERRHG
ncbi:hypothetical protein G3I27_02830, partial [Streptomyces sp. SID10692]|nr:hypothetical protein [Streptomyces sp. SID10692]